MAALSGEPMVGFIVGQLQARQDGWEIFVEGMKNQPDD